MTDRLPAGTVARYGSVARAFHWTIAALILVNLPLGLLNDLISEAVGNTIWLHKSIGLTVLALSVGRILWRLTHRPPPLPGDVPAVERGLAHAVHWTLYALMILLPLTGYIMVSAGDNPLTWFGLFDVPKLAVTRTDPITGIAGEGHELLGFVMLALALGHISAALRHRFILRDGVLHRMLG